MTQKLSTEEGRRCGKALAQQVVKQSRDSNVGVDREAESGETRAKAVKSSLKQARDARFSATPISQYSSCCSWQVCRSVGSKLNFGETFEFLGRVFFWHLCV